MPPTPGNLVYLQVGADRIDAVRPLWEKLNAHHAQLSRHFGGAMRQRPFDDRKRDILAKCAPGKLLIELASPGPNQPPVAYCITIISADGAGEVESIYVEQHLRSRGVGTELMRRALAWLDSHHVTSKNVAVLCENEKALAFYQHFGFYPRAVVMRQIMAGKPARISREQA